MVGDEARDDTNPQLPARAGIARIAAALGIAGNDVGGIVRKSDRSQRGETADIRLACVASREIAPHRIKPFREQRRRI